MLEDSGALRTLLADTNLDSMRPLLDRDLQRVIGVLNASTTEIQKQADILTSQYDILSQQHKRDGDRESRQNREVERLRRKHDAERQNMFVTVIVSPCT